MKVILRSLLCLAFLSCIFSGITKAQSSWIDSLSIETNDNNNRWINVVSKAKLQPDSDIKLEIILTEKISIANGGSFWFAQFYEDSVRITAGKFTEEKKLFRMKTNIYDRTEYVLKDRTFSEFRNSVKIDSLLLLPDMEALRPRMFKYAENHLGEQQKIVRAIVDGTSYDLTIILNEKERTVSYHNACSYHEFYSSINELGYFCNLIEISNKFYKRKD
ncbi:MAG: hypothetical protein RLN81_07390 [Balneolaceae bacterium]